MPRSHPHCLALFSLVPCNDGAKAVLAHPSNSHLLSILSNSLLALDVGFHIRSQSCNTLATLGRDKTDIILEGSSIARLQCSFEIDLNSKVVMLYDRSHGQTTQVFGENAIPFENGRIRRVVVQQGLNTMIGMGGAGCDLIQFRLEWHRNPNQTAEKVRDSISSGQEENPRLTRTLYEALSVVPSELSAWVHTPGNEQLKLRHMRIGDKIGSGQFGDVHKVIDIDSAKFMAVKILNRPSRISDKVWKATIHHTLKHEVETLSRIRHAHIVDYITVQGWEEQKLEIFMGLKEGTLQSFVDSKGYLPPNGENVFYEMLQALDYLAWNGIIHGDVKPENILYVTLPDGQYRFQLGDFGSCNSVVDAVSFAGSPVFMAPEIFQGELQTTKVDIWSLFVTMVWILNAGEFRQRCPEFGTPEDVKKGVLLAASKLTYLSTIEEMAIVDPEHRASAAQMIVKLFQTVGLSTPRSQVPTLIRNSFPTTGATRAPALTPPGPEARIP